MDARFFSFLELVVTGLTVSPPPTGSFYILDTNETFRLPVELIDDYQQFVSLTAKRASWATAGSTMLQKLNTVFEKRRTGMKCDRFEAIE
jgi:hypothetical protein